MTSAPTHEARRSSGAQPDLDAVAAALNAIHARKSLDAAIAVAEYLLESFFGGDLRRLHRKEAAPSLRELARHPDVHLSYNYLWRSLRVYEQLRGLPADVAAALPLSHHVLLLSVEDPERKRALAQVAADEGLTKRRLELRIRRESPPSVRGRPRAPGLQVAIPALRRAADIVDPVLSAQELVRLGPERAKVVLDEAEGLLERLEAELDQAQD